MKKVSIRFLVVALAIIVFLQLRGPATASSTLTNPGFETGDFTGWTVYVPTGGSADVVTSHYSPLSSDPAYYPDYQNVQDAETTYCPMTGTYFALLKTDGPGSYTSLTQTFSIYAGETISGWAFFDNGGYIYSDGFAYNDNASVRILDSAGNVVATPWYRDCATVGSFWDGPWELWSWTATSSGTYTLEYRVANDIDSIYDSWAGFDGVGPIIMDTTAPVVTITSPVDGLITNQNVTLSYTVTDDVSAPEDMSVVGPASGTTHSSEGSYDITITATDEAGNSGSASVSFFIDKTAPTITITGPVAGYYNTDQTVTWTVTDMNLDTVTASHPSPTTFSTDGTYQVTVSATDLAGNSNSTSSAQFVIDKTPPTITINAPLDDAYYTTSSLPAADYTVTDNLDPSPSVSQSGWSDAEGPHTMTVTATDAAGNTATASVSYTVDNTAPISTVTLIGHQEGTNPVEISETTEFQLTATDNPIGAASGVASIEYYIDSGAWITYTGPFTYDVLGDHWVYFRSTDSVGNVETTQTLFFTREPTVEFPSITDEQGNPIDVTITFEQDGSVVATTDGSSEVVLDEEAIYDITIEAPSEDAKIILEDASITADSDISITVDEEANPTHNFDVLVDDAFLKDLAIEISGITASSYTIVITYNQDELDSAGIVDNLYASLWKYDLSTDIWNQIDPANVSDPVSVDPGPPEVFGVTATLDHLCNIAFVFESPELNLEICTGNTQISAGETAEYTVFLENFGAGRANNIDLALTLPMDVVFVSSTISPVWELMDELTSTYHWQWDLMEPGESITFYITVRTSLLFYEGEFFVTTGAVEYYGPTFQDFYQETAQSNEIWIISVKPSGELRTIGLWKHQVLALLDGKGRNQISEADMELYLDMILASTTLFDLNGDGDFSLEEAKEILAFKKADMGKRALQQLLAVYLNLAARAVNSDTEINMTLSDNIGLHQYDDLTTIGEAVQFAMNVLENEKSDLYEDVKDICEEINNGIVVIAK